MCLLGAITGGCRFCDRLLCNSTVTSEVPSPNGALVAASVDEACGGAAGSVSIGIWMGRRPRGLASIPLEDHTGDRPRADFVVGHAPRTTGGTQALSAGTLHGGDASGANFLQEGTLTGNGRVRSVAIGLREAVVVDVAGAGGLVWRAEAIVGTVSLLAAVVGAGLADGGRGDADTSRTV